MTLTALSPLSARVAEWVSVCTLADLPPERGVAALVRGTQIAIVRTHDDRVFAVQQLDPYSDAMVISRGLIGTRGDVATIASPMYKQVFDLATGACLDPVGKEPVALRTWPVRIDGDLVSIGLTEDHGS